jgi:ParB-like chromosome segregation protein Spo0J
MTDNKSWRDKLPIHREADKFPPIEAPELLELGEDIKKHGLKSPAAIFQNPDGTWVLLDGRNRLDAMEAVGIDIEFGNPNHFMRVPADTDPVAYVNSANIQRRHLTAEQKRELIGKLLKAKPDKSDRQIAKEAKVDHKTVAAERKQKEATGEIPQSEKTVGADGKTRQRPARSFKAGKPLGASQAHDAPKTGGEQRKLDREGNLRQEREAAQAHAAEPKATQEATPPATVVEPSNLCAALYYAMTVTMHRSVSDALTELLQDRPPSFSIKDVDNHVAWLTELATAWRERENSAPAK